MPRAEVAEVHDDRFTLEGYLYRAGGVSMPLPEDQARFGFTVLGRVDRPPSLEVLAPAAGATLDTRDSVHVSWSASDPDRLTAVEVWLVRGLAAPQRLARIEAPASGAVPHARGIPDAGRPEPRIAVSARPIAWRGATTRAPCVTGACSLLVVALDEHGRHHDRAECRIGIVVRGAPCRTEPARVLLAASPNPFVRSTRLTASRPAWLDLFDLHGRRVRRVAHGGMLGALEWDGTDDRGRPLDPGIYLARVVSDAGTDSFKLLKLE